MALFDQTSKIGFIGAGAVGGSLGVCLSRAGYRVVAVASRTFASARRFAGRIGACQAYDTAQEVADAAHLVVISTADDAIRSVAEGVTWRPGQGVIHCSGATSLDVFRHPVSQGAVAGAFHPLQAFSSVENGVDSIPGTTFGIEGSPEVRTALADMARAIGGKPVFPGRRGQGAVSPDGRHDGQSADVSGGHRGAIVGTVRILAGRGR